VARIAGVDIPRNKRVEVALTYIYGIGPTSAKQIVAKTNIDPDTRVNNLTEEEVNRIRETVDKEYTVEGDLRRTVSMNIKRLINQVLPWHQAHTRPPRPRPAHQDKRPYPSRPSPHGWRSPQEVGSTRYSVRNTLGETMAEKQQKTTATKARAARARRRERKVVPRGVA